MCQTVRSRIWDRIPAEADKFQGCWIMFMTHGMTGCAFECYAIHLTLLCLSPFSSDWVSKAVWTDRLRFLYGYGSFNLFLALNSDLLYLQTNKTKQNKRNTLNYTLNDIVILDRLIKKEYHFNEYPV